MRISDWSSDVCSSDLADLLIISSMAFAAWAVTNRRIMQSRQAWIAACVVVFVLWLAVVVTGSRSGVAMILIAFVTCILITVRRLRLPSRGMATVSLGVLSLLAGRAEERCVGKEWEHDW